MIWNIIPLAQPKQLIKAGSFILQTGFITLGKGLFLEHLSYEPGSLSLETVTTIYKHTSTQRLQSKVYFSDIILY